jgi:hypothetical protein
MSKHTPGPWIALTNERRPEDADYAHALMRHVVNSAAGVPICALWHRKEPYRNPNHFKAGKFVISEAEATANARLVAAAPDLLASCKELRDALDAAITAMDACGISDLADESERNLWRRVMDRAYNHETDPVQRADKAIAKAEGQPSVAA